MKEKKKISLGRLEEDAAGILLLLMTVVVFIATVCRYTKIFSIPWADELARYLMIWMIFIGVAAGAGRGEHFCVTAFTGQLPLTGQKILGYIRVCVVSAFSLFVAYKMIALISRALTTGQLSPALHLPMGIIYIAVPLGMVLFACSYAIHEIAKLKNMGTSHEIEDEIPEL